MPEQKKDFDYWWSRQGDWVEEPNERRDGTSGVQLLKGAGPESINLYSKKQVNHCYRTLRFPLGRPTVFREQQAIQAFVALGIRVPELVFCAAQKNNGQWRAVLVTEELQGFVSLNEWYELFAVTHAHSKPLLLEKVARMLATFHQAGWQHTCCYGKHIFVKTGSNSDEVEVAMLDLEKARRRCRVQTAALHDMEQLSRHTGKMPQQDWQQLLHHYARELPGLAGKLASLRTDA